MIKKEITSIIQSRKSVYPKEFNGEIIKDKDIFHLLENANHAPSHKMTQPWRFKIFCQNSKKKLLNEIMKVTDFSESKKQNIENRFEKTSHIISICMKKNIEIVNAKAVEEKTINKLEKLQCLIIDNYENNINQKFLYSLLNHLVFCFQKTN